MKRPPLYNMFLNAITTADNTAIDPIRLGMVISGASMIALSAIAVIVNKQPFDPFLFGGGVGAIFGGGGFGLAAKSRDETAVTPVVTEGP